MIIEKCPRCNTARVQTKVLTQEHIKPKQGHWWHLLRCNNQECQKLVLAESDGHGTIFNIYPPISYTLETTATLSQEIKEEFDEAGVCLANNCCKASMVMSRRVLQRCLKEQGCKKHKLADAIDEALATGILRKPFEPIATEIREYGNLSAHPDDDQLENANKEHAKTILEFCRLLIHEFYEIPARAESLKKKREDSKP